MADVVDFTGRSTTPPGEAVPEVVTMLEAMLAAARDGKILAVAVATVETGGFINSGYAWGKDPIAGQILGSVAMMQHKVITHMADGSEKW